MPVGTAFDIEGFERAVARGAAEPEALLDFFHEDVEWARSIG